MQKELEQKRPNASQSFCVVLPQSATSVRVSSANAAAAEHLVVGGYDVSGEVRSDGEPMKKVTFLLYSATVKKEVKYICIELKGKLKERWCPVHCVSITYCDALQ